MGGRGLESCLDRPWISLWAFSQRQSRSGHLLLHVRGHLGWVETSLYLCMTLNFLSLVWASLVIHSQFSMTGSCVVPWMAVNNEGWCEPVEKIVGETTDMLVFVYELTWVGTRWRSIPDGNTGLYSISVKASGLQMDGGQVTTALILFSAHLHLCT